MNIRIPRIRHLRRGLERISGRRLRRLLSWATERAATLTGTGTALPFTASPAEVAASGILTFTGNPTDTLAAAVGTLTLTGNANPQSYATATLTLVANPAENEQVQIGDVTYEFTATPNSPYDVLIGASASDTIDNLIAAITGGAGEGTAYGTGTLAHPDVNVAAGDGDTMIATAVAIGGVGNAIAVADDMANPGNVWDGDYLDGGFDTETVFIGGTMYTFKTAVAEAYDVKIGANASDTLDNLIAAIMGGAGEGDVYGTGTEAHPDVTAAAGDGDTMVVTAKVAGTSGNLIGTFKNSLVAAWGAEHLVNGADRETVLIGEKTYTFQGTLTDVDGNVVIGADAAATLTNLIAAITLGTRQTPATGTLTLGANAANGNNVVLGAKTYTFTNPFVDAENNVAVGGNASESLDNLIAAITGGAGEGTAYGTGTTANAEATAVAGDGDTLVATAITPGLAGNTIASTTTIGGGSVWTGDHLDGGIDRYAAAMTVHEEVTAAAGDGDTMVITAKETGIAGNAIVSVANTAAGAFGAPTLAGGESADHLVAVAHGLADGDGPYTVASDDTIPTGLSGDTLYWVSAIDADHLYLHTNRVDALNGTNPVNFTSAGVGNLTLTPASSAQAIVEYLRQGKSPATIQAETDVDDLI